MASRVADMVALSDAHASELSVQDAAILDFEDSWTVCDVPKEQAIMEQFSLTATRYYQRLNALIDEPAAAAYKPLLISRLRQVRTRRHEARSSRRLASR